MNSTPEAPPFSPRRGGSIDVERLIEEHHARIYAYLRRRAGGDADAVELTQRTFTRAWGALDRFEGRSSVVSWLHGIAHHVWQDWRRSQSRFEGRTDAWWEQIPSEVASPDETLMKLDSAGAVFAAVDRLDDSQRDVVHLHYYQGLSLAETADALGIATSTVKYRLREALGVLQRGFNIKTSVSSSSTSSQS